MKNTSLHLSSKLEDAQANLYSLIAEVFKSLKFPYLLVGASARDIILEGVYNIPCPRVTLDTDLAIMLNSWQEFSEVKQSFIESTDFKTKAGVEHRLFSQTFGIVDLVPFGTIANNDKISWPPEYSSVMNVMGFDDAYQCSVSVKINDRTTIRCCSLVGLSILKMLALGDRYHLTKDADDLSFVMMNYLKAGQHDRLFQEYTEFINDDFDYDFAGVRLLGRDISSSASGACRDQLVRIIDSEINDDKHFTLARSLSKLNLSFDDAFSRAINLITALQIELRSAEQE